MILHRRTALSILLLLTLPFGCGGGNKEQVSSGPIGPITPDSGFAETPTREQIQGNWRVTSILIPPYRSYPYTATAYCPSSFGEDASCGEEDILEFGSDGTLSYQLQVVINNRLQTIRGTSAWTYSGDKITFSPGFANRRDFTLRRHSTNGDIQFISKDGYVGRILTRF